MILNHTAKIQPSSRLTNTCPVFDALLSRTKCGRSHTFVFAFLLHQFGKVAEISFFCHRNKQNSLTMANYINPFTDIGFKRIFGQEFSKPLLIDFLNNLLIGEKRIVNLKFLDKEQPPVFVDDRSLIYDIYCELDNKEKIIVEMQNCEQSYFKRRSIYYVSEAIARQGEKGPEWQYDIKGVYLIAFLNFRRPDIG